MREPVVPPVFGDLRLLAAVPLHAPNLHQAGVCSVIPNVLSVRGILRAVVKATLCQSLFHTAVHRDRVHVHFLPAVDVAKSAVGHLRAVRRPAVQKTRAVRRHQTRLTAFHRHNINTGSEVSVVKRHVADRKLVMDVGGMAVALSGVHAERFEEVNKNEADKKERELFYKRNLHERNAFIDRYFHQVKTAQEVSAQVENIEILRLQTLADVRDKKLDMKDAYDTFYFMIEEIGYYYAPFIDYFKDELRPIFEAGRTVKEEIEKAIKIFKDSDKELHNRCETEFEALQNNYGYLFE